MMGSSVDGGYGKEHRGSALVNKVDEKRGRN